MTPQTSRGLRFFDLACAVRHFFVTGYGLSELIFMLTGRSAEIWTALIVRFIALCLFPLFSRLFIWSSRLKSHRIERLENFRNKFFDDAIEAMDRIARGDFSVFVPVNENGSFSETAESVNRMARELGSMENIRQDFIGFSLSLEKAVFCGDEGLLTQVWINLIHNAIKFTPGRGEIGVVLIKGEKDVICSISDTGAGISEEDRIAELTELGLKEAAEYPDFGDAFSVLSDEEKAAMNGFLARVIDGLGKKAGAEEDWLADLRDPRGIGADRLRRLHEFWKGPRGHFGGGPGPRCDFRDEES